MITLNNINFKYPNSKFKLANINYNFNDNKIYAIIGNNGSGKSTLTQIISGILKPQKGEVLINNEKLKNIKKKNIVKIGIVFSNPDNQIIFNNVYDDIAFILKNLLAISIFVLIVFAFNLIFDSLINSLIICAKIILVCNFSYIISKTLNIVKIAEGITYLLYPLKLFKFDINQISLMIVIALNFVSIITKEAKSLKLALKARNINFNLKTLFTKSHIIFIMFFANIFKRVDMLELSLRSKNFN